MAHFILEYSNNLDSDQLNVQVLFEKLINTAVGTDSFPLKGMRCRAYPSSEYRIADGNPDHAFAHLTMLIGPGRELEEQKSVAKMLFEVLKTHFAPMMVDRGVALSIELKELAGETRFNHNNVGDYL